MRKKLPLLQISAQTAFDKLALHRIVVHDGSEKLIVLSPSRLGLIHRRVGVLHQGFCVDSVIRKNADADTHGNMKLMPGNKLRDGECGAQLFSNQRRILGLLDFGEQDYELVAPLATHRVRIPDICQQTFGDRLQDLIADGMPERVVDVLESIQIQRAEDRS